jgi:hypothetical protein
MEENFKSLKKILLKWPVLTSPKEKVHRDRAKEKILAVRIQVGVVPYFLQGAHTLVCISKLSFNICVILEIVRDALS